LDNGIPSQMVLTKTISKKGQLMSVATKIGIQISAKLGGQIWGVRIPARSVMIIGMDSYHDPKRKAVSIGAFVSTTNPQCTSFYSRVILQKTQQELIDGLRICFQESVQEFHRQNNAFPEKIIMYRDGVGDGQLGAVIEHELGQILRVLPLLSPGYDPQFAMIVVKKRGTTKFFAGSTKTQYNPIPGTVVDHTVTNIDWYDFYLISQCARQGTAAPTHFHVIWDKTNFQVDHMQRLAFKLSHMYYNWPGTVRVPMVCQYAHKLAYLVGLSLQAEFHKDLKNKLFYL